MGADGAIKVRIGDLIPLKVQESRGDITKVIKVTLFDLSDFTVLPGTFPITLVHKNLGAYHDNSFPYPQAVRRTYAQFEIFDSDGITRNTTGDQFVHDIYEVDDDFIVQGSELTATIETGELQASIEESSILIASLE